LTKILKILYAEYDMSKKTLALIAGLTVLTLVLVVLALNTGQKAPQDSKDTTNVTSAPSPTVPAHTVIQLAPNPVAFTGNTATVNVNIDTSDNPVTAAQFEVTYDPTVLNYSSIRQGDFFQNALVLINQVDRTAGKITYAIGLTPAGAQNPKTGTGTVATITFTRRSTAAVRGTTPLGLENVLVSAKGIAPSVLKSASGSSVDLSTATNTTASPSGR
jgi:hypothetical protein